MTLSTYLGSNQPVLRAKTELQAKLRFDRALKRYQLEDLKLNGEAAGEPFKGKTLTFAAQGQLLADLAAGVAEWNSLKPGQPAARHWRTESARPQPGTAG